MDTRPLMTTGKRHFLAFVFVFFVSQAAGTNDLSTTDTGTYFHDKTFDGLQPPEMTSWFAADSNIECARQCQNEAWCNSFFYCDVSKMCAPQRMVYSQIPQDRMHPATGCRYFRLTSVRCPRLHDYVIERISATCYRVVTSSRLLWREARAACSANKDTLVMLEPVAKAQFLQDFLRTNIDTENSTLSFSIGASRPEERWGTPLPAGVTSDFVWINGQPVDLNATWAFWKEGTFTSSELRDIVVMRSPDDFQLNDARGDQSRRYICERPLT